MVNYEMIDSDLREDLESNGLRYHGYSTRRSYPAPTQCKTYMMAMAEINAIDLYRIDDVINAYGTDNVTVEASSWIHDTPVSYDVFIHMQVS